jgi:hypothetical protein
MPGDYAAIAPGGQAPRYTLKVLQNDNARNCHSEQSEESALAENKKQIPRPEPAPGEVEEASE